MGARQFAVRAAAIAVLSSLSSHGAAQGYGLGMRSCGDFVSAYASDPAATEDLFFTWAQGFMSALNLSFAANIGAYRYIDPNGLETYKVRIRSYCTSYPSSQYAQAVLDLYNSLPPNLPNAK